MDPLTNLVGAVLVVLSVETQPLTDTNQVAISCKDAGCTDTGTCVEIQIDPRIGPVHIETEPAHRDPRCFSGDPLLPGVFHLTRCNCRPAQYRTGTAFLVSHQHTSNVVTCVATQTTITVGARPTVTLVTGNTLPNPFGGPPLGLAVRGPGDPIPLYKVIWYDITPEGKARGIGGQARVEGVR